MPPKPQPAPCTGPHPSADLRDACTCSSLSGVPIGLYSQGACLISTPGGLRGLGARGEELTVRSEGGVTRMPGAGGMQRRAGAPFLKSPPSLTAGLAPLLCSGLTPLPASSLSSNPGTFSPCTPPTPRTPRCPVHTSLKPGWPTLRASRQALNMHRGAWWAQTPRKLPCVPPTAL